MAWDNRKFWKLETEIDITKAFIVLHHFLNKLPRKPFRHYWQWNVGNNRVLANLGQVASCNYSKTKSSIYRCFIKGVLKIGSKVIGEHPRRSVILIKLLCSFTGITLRHRSSPVYLPQILRTTFHKNTYLGLLLVKAPYKSGMIAKNISVLKLEQYPDKTT